MPPTASGKSYPVLVSALNKDGNPVGGIEVPEIAVPTATYSGRNVRAAGFGEGDLCGLSGSYIPFAATRADRMATGDSRPSLEERYSSPQDYADKRKRAVEALAAFRPARGRCCLGSQDAAYVGSSPTLKSATGRVSFGLA